MGRVAVICLLLAVVGTGCDRGEAASVADAPSEGSPAVAPPPVATPPPDATPSSPDGAQPPATDGDDRAAVCARALRCCEAAFAVEGLPEIYAGRRDIACASIASIPDAAGCRMAIRSWSGMVGSAPAAAVPDSCLE